MQRQRLGLEGLAEGGEAAPEGGLAAQDQQQGDEVLQVDGGKRQVDMAVAFGLDAQQDRAAVAETSPVT